MHKKLFILAPVALVAGSFGLTHMGSDTLMTNTPTVHTPAVASYEVHPTDVVAALQSDRDIILLDVRTQAEHDAVHLEHSLLVPVTDISKASLVSAGLGGEYAHADIYVYCRSGNRSRTAYETLSALGYTNVKSVAGGMNQWTQLDLPYTVQ